ncbi:MAG: sulfatase-like hydrolase/transferase, partial [Bacteroidetes bacterium]|nr:sulfatase-like hydrolase/transferase [Bacteroidota bacterium]
AAGSGQLDSSEYTLAQRIRDSKTGIGRAQIGKWHLNNPMPQANLKMPLFFGYEHFEGPFIGQLPSYTNWTKNTNGVNSTVTTYATTEEVNNAISWLRTQGSKPVFLWLAFNAPHSPYHLPPADLHSYSSLSGTAQDIRARPKEYFKAMVQAMDHEIGRLFDSLRSMKRLDSTDIIFIGDNGNTKQTAQNTDTSRVKGTIYEYGIRVPMIISGPSVRKPGRSSAAMVHEVDLFETIPALLGLNKSLPAGVISDGRSLMPIINNAGDSVRPWVFSEVFQIPASKDDGKCIKTRNYKLMRFDDGHEEFYLLSKDPNERDNLLSKTLDATASQQYQYLCRELETLTGGATKCQSTGLQDASVPGSLLVYPNPAGRQLFVSGLAPGTLLRISDLNGRELLRGSADGPLLLQGLAPGIYLLQAGDKVLRVQVAGCAD